MDSLGAQMIQNNAEKQFVTIKHNSEILGTVISLSQIVVFPFFIVV